MKSNDSCGDGTELVAYLQERALELCPGASDDFRIQSVVQSDLRATPPDSAIAFHDTTLCVASRGTGFATLSVGHQPEVLDRALGQDARRPSGLPVEVALTALDSCTPDASFSASFESTSSGTPARKAGVRARILRDIVESVGSQQRILLVGAVPSIAASLIAAGHSVLAFDLDQSWRDRKCGGARVVTDGPEAYGEYLAESSVMIATGMTLFNGTIFSIVERLVEARVGLVLYCQSGAHLAPILPQSWPLLATLSEPFPNYFYGGTSTFQVWPGSAASAPIRLSSRSTDGD